MRESAKEEADSAWGKSWTIWLGNAGKPKLAGSAGTGVGSAAISLHLFMDAVSLMVHVFSSTDF